MSPQRLISVVPSQTELLFDLGLDDTIVGVTRFCIHPADRVRNKPIVGGTKTLNLDRIHDLRPDLILANKEENTRAQIEALQQQYRVHVTDMATIPEALSMIREVGTLVGRSRQAESIITRITNSLPAFPSDSASPSVAYLIWRKPYMVAAGGTFIDAMLTAAGFRNAFAHQRRYPELDPDALRAARPDLIFLSSEPYPFSDKHRAEFQALCPAARVAIVDGEIFSWYGSRLLQAGDYFKNLRNQLDYYP
ncbi:helical backbone metal receptor [Spirosoma sp. 209]|uniref:helical backbone metal receptor n=1 Tax=Spirosoma sp. 209 TaxID=1955701 RepID=UPI00098D186D|nr:helical backbone metal receptor [Spirosoma sp. 209]